MKKIIFFSATALFFSIVGMAQSTDLAKSDKKSDMKDLRKDMREENRDKKLRNTERKEGDKKEVKELNKEIKSDKKDISADKKDLKKDGVKEPGRKARRQIREERKEHSGGRGH